MLEYDSFLLYTLLLYTSCTVAGYPCRLHHTTALTRPIPVHGSQANVYSAAIYMKCCNVPLRQCLRCTVRL